MSEASTADPLRERELVARNLRATAFSSHRGLFGRVISVASEDIDGSSAEDTLVRTLRAVIDFERETVTADAAVATILAAPEPELATKIVERLMVISFATHQWHEDDAAYRTPLSVGRLLSEYGQNAAATRMFEFATAEARDFAEHYRDARPLRRALSALAHAHTTAGEMQQAVAIFEEALLVAEDIERQSGDKEEIAFALHDMASSVARKEIRRSAIETALGTLRKDGSGRPVYVRGLLDLPRENPTSSGPRVEVEHRAVPVNDLEASTDWLDITPDVQSLARLIASRSTKPPLAIALLAPWGAGKSSFMNLLEKEVKNLAMRGGPFHERIHVVRFNAWDYSDGNILLSMLRQVFKSLSDDVRSARTETTGALVDVIPDAARGIVEERLRELEARRELLRDESFIGRTRALFGLLPEMGRALFGRRHPVRRRIAIWSIVASVVILAGSATVWFFARDSVARLDDILIAAYRTAVSLPLIALLIALVGALRSGWRRTKVLRDSVGSSISDLLLFTSEDLEREISSLRSKLAIRSDGDDALATLESIVLDSSLASQRDLHRGVVGLVRDQLEIVGSALREGREVSAEDSDRTASFSRIVLHVDDLDRCSPERVMDVLHAVNLLQVSGIFVVVVSMDPVWLERAMESHLQSLFPEGGSTSGRELESPLDFLDKVFQIPYRLSELQADAAESFLRRLMRESQILGPLEQTSLAEPTSRSGGRASAAPQTEMSISDGERQEGMEREIPVRGWGGQGVRQREVRNLTLTRDERDFTSRLARMLETPRSIKRFINLYQLLRLGSGTMPGSGYVDLSSELRAPGLLLALSIAVPGEAGMVFERIMSSGSAEPIRGVVRGVADNHFGVSRDWGVGARMVAGASHPRCSTCHRWERVMNSIDGLFASEVAPPERVDRYRMWTAEVARYSFYRLVS